MKAPTTLTSSVVILQAMGLAPDGVRAKTPGACALCGLPIAVGDLSAPLSLGTGFMDDLSLAARGSKLICGYCSPLLSAVNLRLTGFGVFSPAGVQPFRKWADVATALSHPPKPPFVMVYATANNQHMAWRAPVNYSSDLFYVRVGLRDLKIRRQSLVWATEACQRLGTDLAAKEPSPTAKTLPNPFQEISPDLKDPNHGAFKFGALRKEFTEKFSAEIAGIRQLTAGEVWALRFILTPGAGQPVA